MKTLKKLCLATILFMVSGFHIAAQEDVTKFFLTNHDFDSNFDYQSGNTTVVKEEIKEIKGWIPDLSATYTITGVYEYGFKGTYNSSSVPAESYTGGAGGGLALSTGWDQTFCYYQNVTLPAGTYTINVPTYNGKSVSAGTSKLAWIPTSGTTVSSTLAAYPSKKWTLDQITFTLSKQTTGKVQIGYKAASGGSANSANLLIDYVQILATDMTVNKTGLKTNLQTANKLYGTGTGIEADSLKKTIDAAQIVYDNTESTMPQVLEANYLLECTMEYYRIVNASETNPLDCTSYIQNPSFETNGTTGWTVKNMGTQSNAVFTLKNGTYYIETWVNIGSQIDDASATQTLKNLPIGNYKLMANALHIQQNGTGSTVNKGSAQTGVYLFAGSNKVAVNSIKQYAVTFSIFEEKNETEIGLIAENPTGNYLCLDNFRLQYIGAISSASYVQEIEQLIALGEEYIHKGVQTTASESLTTAMNAGKTALQGIGTDENGNTLYDSESLSAARTQLLDAMELAKASRALYDQLKSRIDYGQKVCDWWEGDERKANGLNNLKTYLETANQKLTDYTLTYNGIKSATNILNSRIKVVDKKIYCSSNACGTETQLNQSTSQWCYERSMQSKHWIIFWEAGYGTSAPASVESILNTADNVFEYYANELKFITINQGTSKTDNYKMIIRLRHTEDWEASGSGIDNTIGLLTLSRWAYTSREGQTLAHEIGHCFQYQTNCDNKNWNGWMYNWGSGNYNVFWEMCAQWQAYKFYPNMQFNNEWLTNTLNGLHKHPLCVDLRYNNYFIQDYFAHKHGIDILGRLWNESRNPEDPLQAYMRLTMNTSLSAAEKLDQLNDEMWEYGARMTTFDMDHIRTKGAGTIGKRSQTKLTKDSEGFWSPTTADCIENFGNNAIRLNVPSGAKTVYVDFIGEAGKSGYTTYNVTKAGWRYGFVALQKDGTRIYGDIATADYNNPEGSIAFECPANCAYLWLVVSGAPTAYWTRDWIDWDGVQGNKEQWPYKVKFYQTNVYGNANNNTYPDAISEINSDTPRPQDNNVYSITGQLVRKGSTSLEGLPSGFYIINGKKVIK